MQTRGDFDVSGLPTIAFGNRNQTWWGTTGFMVVETTTLGILISSYFYLARNQDGWPPGGTPLPGQMRWTPEAPGAGGGTFSDFLAFRYLITPAFITVIYVIGAVLLTLGALATVVSGAPGAAVSGIVLLVFGNLWWRIVLEFVMVLFRINASLQSIERRGRGM